MSNRPHPPGLDRVITWAAQRRTPFKKNGAGAPDAAIWLAVLEAATTGADVAFITDNHQDFRDEQQDFRAWHPDLRGDLDAIGVPLGRVRRYVRVLDFNEEHLPQKLANAHADEFFADKGSVAALATQIEDAAYWYSLDMSGRDWPIGADADDAHLAEFAVRNIEYIRADPFGDDDYSFTVWAHGLARFDLYLLKGDAYALPDWSQASVGDWDWNESMVLAEMEVDAKLLVEVIPSEDLAVSIEAVEPETSMDSYLASVPAPTMVTVSGRLESGRLEDPADPRTADVDPTGGAEDGSADEQP